MCYTSQLTTHNSQLTTHNSQLTTHNSQLTTHNSQLTTHNSYHNPIDNGVTDSNQFSRCLFKSPYLSNRLGLTLLFIFSLFTTYSSHAVLSAKTVKVIQGSKPYFVLADGTKLKNLNQLLGFEMPKQNGSRGTAWVDATKDVVTAPKGMKLSDVKALVVADNQPHTLPVSYQQDDDGDRGSSLGSITAVWKVDGQVVSDLKQPLSPCVSNTLTISVNHLQAQTSYGIPHQGDSYGSASKAYAFMPNPADLKLCYIQPQSMKVYTRDTVYPQGYNPAVWDAGKGFSVSKMKVAGKLFPTTGFDKAVFELIGSGSDQSQYRCRNLSSGKWGSLSKNSASKSLGQGCKVTYNHSSKKVKPQTPVTITMDYTADNGKTWTKIDSYTIPVPSKWAISPVGESHIATYGNTDSLSTSTQFPALDACRKVGSKADNKTTGIAEGRGQTAENRTDRQRFMYRRDELTNSKLANRTQYPEGAGNAPVGSYYSRDIGTFTGEWGEVYDYAKSPWSDNNWYLTAEAYGTHYQFGVSAYGGVGWNYPLHSTDVVVCRGE